MRRPSAVALALLLVAVIGCVAAGLGIGVRASAGGYADVDEPQYLLTGLSLAEDYDLDITDELADLRWTAFHSPGALPVQTAPLPDGRTLSPHDPLLPLLLAGPMRLGEVVTGRGGHGPAIAAKLTLSVLAGALASLLLWVAVRRLRLPLGVSTVGVAIAAASAPLAVYGQQVYPELPAGLTVLAAVAALTGSLRGRGLTVLAGALVALPWLSVKYVPVTLALAVVAVVVLRRRRRALVGLLGTLGLAAIGYVVGHELLYGGVTVYAAGDAFTAGEFGVVGAAPDYPGRSIRLLGLLIDRDFGVAAWQPAWLLLVPAAAAWATRPAPYRLALGLPLTVGWLTATYVALTMQGYWWPGRQLVVVAPLAVLVVLHWVAGLPARGRAVAGALGVAGVAVYGVVLAHGLAGDTTWVGAPDRTDLHQPFAWLLPDDRVLAAGDRVRYGLWVVAAVLTVAVAGRRRGRTTAVPPAPAATPARTSH